MSKRILVVDDDPDIRSLVKNAIIMKGHEAIAAGDGFSAVTLAIKYRPDVVVLDVMMPKMSGFQVCQNLRARPEFQATPILFLTAKDNPQDEAWGKKVGADEYITKPFEIHQVVAKVEEMLERVQEIEDRPDYDPIDGEVQFRG